MPFQMEGHFYLLIEAITYSQAKRVRTAEN